MPPSYEERKKERKKAELWICWYK